MTTSKTKCIFKDTKCIGSDSNEDCVDCLNAPDLTDLEQERILLLVGKYRDKYKEKYGIRAGYVKTPTWLDKIADGNLANIPCQDHIRYWKNSVILEPYHVVRRDIQRLEIFCDKNNLSYDISGNSAHFPGRTFRIILEKIKKGE